MEAPDRVVHGTYLSKLPSILRDGNILPGGYKEDARDVLCAPTANVSHEAKTAGIRTDAEILIHTVCQCASQLCLSA